MYKRVFIVKEGRWGTVKPEVYREQIEMYQRYLDEAKDFQGKKAAQVTVVDTAEEAEKRVKMEADVVVFISKGMEREAEKMARENQRVRVVVFTGDIPEGKIVWALKSTTAGRGLIQDIVLNW
jgi:hypothetical protein